MPMNRTITYLVLAFPSCLRCFSGRGRKNKSKLCSVHMSLGKTKTSKQKKISRMIKKCRFTQWILLLKICGFHIELMPAFFSPFHGKSFENLIIIMAQFLSPVAINDCLHRKANSLHYKLPFLHQLRKAFLN